MHGLRRSTVNGIFFVIVLIAFGVAGVRQVMWELQAEMQKSPMELLALAMVDTAEASVTLAIGLVGDGLIPGSDESGGSGRHAGHHC